MKKKWMLAALAAVMSVSMTSPVLAGHIYAGEGVEKTVSYDADGNKVITLTFDPAQMPEELKQKFGMTTEISAESSAVSETVKKPEMNHLRLTKPPEIGETLGDIFNEESQRFTENYRHATIGECTWYAEGRVKEVYGVELPYMGCAKEWLKSAQQAESLAAITDLTDVPEQSVAVFAPAWDAETRLGHVEFVEYVSRDEDGKPVDIYFTEANGGNDIEKGKYNAGIDGAVRRKSFEEFTNQYGLRLIGYVVPKQENN